MPELPEVEITKRKLEPLVGKTLQGFWTDWPRALKSSFSPADLADDIATRKVLNVHRKGKVVFLELGVPYGINYKNEERLLAFHQRMSGRFIVFNQPVTDPDPKLSQHTHAKLFFEDGTEVWFRDPRKFGVIWYGNPQEVGAHGYFSKLGTDALEVTEADFTARLKKFKGALKPVLLRQDFVAGIGNIVADEMLWETKLHPTQLVGSLTAPQMKKLHGALHAVLERSIAAKGTSLRDWQHPDGGKGEFQTIKNIYGRGGEPCKRCKTMIKRIVVGGRGTWVCEKCQK